MACLFGARPEDAKPARSRGKRSIPKAWRDLDKGCLEFALNELTGRKFGRRAIRELRSA